MVLPIHTIPFLRSVKRLFMGRGTLEAIAHRTEILCPAKTTNRRPSIFLPGQLDKITTFESSDPFAMSTSDSEIASAVCTTFTSAPTIAYHIKNAILINGSVYVDHFRHPLIADKSLLGPGARECHHFNSRALASTLLGSKYFFHWLADDCTKHLLAEEFTVPLCLRTPAYGHKQKYQEYFGQQPVPTDRARIDKLILFQDFSQNSSKRKRYHVLRDRIKSRFPTNSTNAYVYLRRS